MRHGRKVNKDSFKAQLFASTKKKFKVKRQLPLVNSSKSDTKRYIEGYLATYDLDRINDEFTKEALEAGAKDLLRQGSNTVFFNHDRKVPVGKILEAVADEIGLFIKVMVSKSPSVEGFWTMVQEGILNTFSIGFIPKKTKTITDDDGNYIKTVISDIEALEASIVSIPMNRYAGITNVEGKEFSFKPTAQTRRGKKMKNKKTASGTRSENIGSVVGEIIDQKLAGKLSEFEKSLLASVREIVKSKGEEPLTPPTHEEKMEKQIDELKKTISELVGKRKGAPDINDDDEGDDSDTLIVDFNNANDPNNQKAAEYYMNTPEGNAEFNNLPKEQKSFFNGIYLKNSVLGKTK